MRLRVLKNSAATLTSPTFVGTDDETPTPATGTPTCAVTREDGTALANLTVTAASDPGVYTAALPTTHTGQLDRLVVTWTGTVSGQVQVYTDEVEVVGGHYVTIPEIRAMRGVSDPGKFTTAEVRAARDEFEDMVEAITGVAWVRRYERDVLSGNGQSRLVLSKIKPRTLLSITVDGTSQTLTSFSIEGGGTVTWENGGVFTRPTTGDTYNVAIAYEHGFDSPPANLRREALKWIRDRLLQDRSAIPENAISSTFEGQTIRFSTPDPSRGRWTGIMSLDAVLNQPGIMHFRPGIA